jgi:hypothetical protein
MASCDPVCVCLSHHWDLIHLQELYKRDGMGRGGTVNSCFVVITSSLFYMFLSREGA